MPESQTVKEALNKKAAYGKDLDIDHYDVKANEQVIIDDMENSEYKKYMENVGIVADEMERTGTLLFVDNAPSHCSTKIQEGLEMMSTKEALEKYDGLKDYYWKAMDPTKDKYTAKTYLEDGDGYFIRVKSGYHIKNPVQTCMLLKSNKSVDRKSVV
mgnify:CR=1 FL=1